MFNFSSYNVFVIFGGWRFDFYMVNCGYSYIGIFGKCLFIELREAVMIEFFSGGVICRCRVGIVEVFRRILREFCCYSSVFVFVFVGLRVFYFWL